MVPQMACDESFEPATLYTYNEESDQWIKQEVMTRIGAKPSAHGSERVCYKSTMVDENGDKSAMIVKMFKQQRDDEAYFNAALAQLIAKRYANDFNKLGARRQISFVSVYVMRLPERGGVLVTAEPELHGKYVKHNDNDGNVDTSDVVPQAFSHFSWERSDRTLLICDIQGVGDTYTDPAIQTVDSNLDLFGDSNLGKPAIRKFFASHRCNCVCRALSLSPPDAERRFLALPNASGPPPNLSNAPSRQDRTHMKLHSFRDPARNSDSPAEPARKGREQRQSGPGSRANMKARTLSQPVTVPAAIGRGRLQRPRLARTESESSWELGHASSV